MDTIASIATAVGAGGIAVIRISGPEAKSILSRVFAPHVPQKMSSRMLTYGYVMENGQKVDECMAVWMRAPHTYTTEDVAEIQCHGGQVTAQRVLDVVLRSGARLAEPGEFTKRAFFGGRIDLTQAEGVMDLISARTERAARAGLQQMGGYLSERIHALQSELLDTIAYIEAYLDYPDEDIEPLTAEKARTAGKSRPERTGKRPEKRTGGQNAQRRRAHRVSGQPEHGQILAAQRAAEGTACHRYRHGRHHARRAARRAEPERPAVQLTDTAGLREASDEVERIGIDRAREELRGADVVLLVIDRSRPLGEEEKALLGQPGAPLVVALNKSDLDAVTTDAEVHKLSPQAKIVDTCAKTGEGVEKLRQTLYETALRGASPEEAYLTNERHIQAARTAAEAIGRRWRR